MTTHYMPEAEELCDRIAIINQGELVAIDTVHGLKKHAHNKGLSQDASLEDVYISMVSGGVYA